MAGVARGLGWGSSQGGVSGGRPVGAAASSTANTTVYQLHYYATRQNPGANDAAEAMRRLEWMTRMRTA
jgi:hypothetical protein